MFQRLVLSYKDGSLGSQNAITLYTVYTISPEGGPVWKMVNTWPKKSLCYPLSKIGAFDFLISWIFRKKNKEIKKVDFWSLLAVFVSPSMLIYVIQKKKTEIFIYNSINMVDKHANQFVSVNSIVDEDSEVFCYKDNKVM